MLSKTFHRNTLLVKGNRLNPCFNGICSRRIFPRSPLAKDGTVLILVLMEYALEVSMVRRPSKKKTCLNPCFNGICSRRSDNKTHPHGWVLCLNPCFNGICSRSIQKNWSGKRHLCLNPCFNGICSRRATSIR